MNLVIVESPTKAKTIGKFLSDIYIVVSSFGHVRDLPQGELGVDTDNNFKPHYVIPTKARKNVNALKKELKKTEKIILATDGDREGEAIAWHLAQVLELDAGQVKNSKLKVQKVERIVFHEITKSAIDAALKNPRNINMHLVNAQQARRILDRLVGYKLSPFLWKKVVKGLSAGRVQSVAVRLIVEKERERDAFKQQEYYSVEALLQRKSSISNSQFSDNNLNSDNQTFAAKLHAKNADALDKLAIKNKEEADGIVKILEGANYTVAGIEAKEVKKNPFPPFTTSTLQQAAGARFGWPARRTMMLAQNLYERGFITYHRTDSMHLAPSAVAAVRDYIEKELGKKYIPETARLYKTRSKGAQEAHEAIRPTDPANAPHKIKMEPAQKKMYELIWQRFVASQMNPAIFDAKTIDITTNTPYALRATGSTCLFDGFLKIYPMKVEENELPKLSVDDALDLKHIEALQHSTQPPARYSEATLVKALEKHGIGRPSTYAAIISTIQDRNYTKKDEHKRLAPTEIGIMVNDLLVSHFPNIVDIEFTALMEKNLDKVAEGKEDWQELLKEFYEPFEKNLEKKYEEVKKVSRDEKIDKNCPECGKFLLKKLGRFGEFYACSGFPECKYTESMNKKNTELDVHCPQCVEGDVVTKKTRRGKEFFGCSKWPNCKFATWYKPHIEEIPGTAGTRRVIKCPQCERGVLVEKGKKLVCSDKECKYVKNT